MAVNSVKCVKCEWLLLCQWLLLLFVNDYYCVNGDNRICVNDFNILKCNSYYKPSCPAVSSKLILTGRESTEHCLV